MDSFRDMPLGKFVDQAASGEPVPGGGGIAALAGALGAAMAAMAANFTVGKPKFAEHDELMRRTLAVLEPLIGDLRDAVDGDARAFTGIAAAYRLPKDTPEQKAGRKRAIDESLLASMAVPLRVLEKCLETVSLLPELAKTANPNLLSDVEVAAIMIEAAARAARVNVLANSSSLGSEAARVAEVEAGLAVERVSALAAEALEGVCSRRGRD